MRRQAIKQLNLAEVAEEKARQERIEAARKGARTTKHTVASPVSLHAKVSSQYSGTSNANTSQRYSSRRILTVVVVCAYSDPT